MNKSTQRHSGSKRYIVPEDRPSKRTRSIARMSSLLYEADAESGESDDTALERESLVNRHRRLRKRDITEFSGRNGHLNDKAKKQRHGVIRMPTDSLWRVRFLLYLFLLQRFDFCNMYIRSVASGMKLCF